MDVHRIVMYNKRYVSLTYVYSFGKIQYPVCRPMSYRAYRARRKKKTPWYVFWGVTIINRAKVNTRVIPRFTVDRRDSQYIHCIITDCK